MKRFFFANSFSMLDMLLIVLVGALAQATCDAYGVVAAGLVCVMLGLAVSRLGVWLQRKAGIRTVTLGGGL